MSFNMITIVEKNLNKVQTKFLQLGPCIFKLWWNKTNEMHIQSEVNHIFRISMLLLHVSALYECHLQGAQRILMKLYVCYVISAELIEGREWIPSVCCQPKEPSVNDSQSVLSTDYTQTVSTPYLQIIRHLWRGTRTITSGSFGLPEDGTHKAPKHVAATLIF
jgi:hypothetical protein